MLQGYLSSQGVTIQRRRLCESIMRINPMKSMTRWQHALSRRAYHVAGPNSLWHIDTHHSLMRWRFAVQGGIDGYFCMVVYLSCSTNNKAEITWECFQKATREFGVPFRVRSHKRGENQLVCYFMVSHRGPGRSSHIAGSSAHNPRIERLWRDVYRCVFHLS